MLISVQLQQQIDIVSCYERWKRKSARAEKYHKKSRKENGDKKKSCIVWNSMILSVVVFGSLRLFSPETSSVYLFFF